MIVQNEIKSRAGGCWGQKTPVYFERCLMARLTFFFVSADLRFTVDAVLLSCAHTCSLWTFFRIKSRPWVSSK